MLSVAFKLPGKHVHALKSLKAKATSQQCSFGAAYITGSSAFICCSFKCGATSKHLKLVRGHYSLVKAFSVYVSCKVPSYRRRCVGSSRTPCFQATVSWLIRQIMYKQLAMRGCMYLHWKQLIGKVCTTRGVVSMCRPTCTCLVFVEVYFQIGLCSGRLVVSACMPGELLERLHEYGT